MRNLFKKKSDVSSIVPANVEVVPLERLRREIVPSTKNPPVVHFHGDATSELLRALADRTRTSRKGDMKIYFEDSTSGGAQANFLASSGRLQATRNRISKIEFTWDDSASHISEDR